MIQIPSNDDNTFRAQFENFEHHISDLAINKYTAHLPPPTHKSKTCNVILEIQGPEVKFIIVYTFNMTKKHTYRHFLVYVRCS